jgi:hypothetical protein
MLSSTRVTSLPLHLKHSLFVRSLVEMINASVFWLNAFPHRLGFSPTLSPRTIITGKHVDYNRHCRYEFGQYVQTHEEHGNSMQCRTIGALALRPTGNDQGNFLFFSLSTGRLLNRVHATSLPMPDDVIDRINTIGRRQKADPGLVFTNRPHQLFDDDSDAMMTVATMFLTCLRQMTFLTAMM